MVARIIVNNINIILIKAVVKFLIDGVKIYDYSRRKANGKLKKEI
jgi:hypothetical protein